MKMGRNPFLQVTFFNFDGKASNGCWYPIGRNPFLQVTFFNDIEGCIEFFKEISRNPFLQVTFFNGMV